MARTPEGSAGAGAGAGSRMDRLYQAARLYYVEHRTQAEVAARMGLSRSRVSRLLQEAWEAGIVSVRLTYPEPPSVEEAARALKERYRLSYSRVTGLDDGSSPEITRRRIGQAAAGALQELLEDGQVVGLSWGRTLFEMVQALEGSSQGVSPLALTAVPLLGAVGAADPRYQASVLAFRMVRAVGGLALPLHAPAYADTPEAAATLLRQPSISQVAHLWERLDMALVGIGPSVYHSPVVQAGDLAGLPILELLRQKAVGDLCTHFFDAQGKPCRLSTGQRFVGIPLERLRQVPRVIGVAGGPEKAPPIRIALKHGYINGLVTDLPTAQALLTR